MAISVAWGATGTRTHRGFAVLLGALLWSGCASEARRDPATLYSRAEVAFQAGDLPNALRNASAGHAAWRNAPASAWYWNFLLLRAEILLAQSETQTALPLLRESPSPQVPDRDRVEVRLMKDRAQAAHAESRDTDSAELLDRALRKARDLSAEDLLPEIEVRRALFLASSGNFELAEAENREAAAVAERHHDRYWQATAIGAMGFLLLRRYRYDEAIPWFLRSLEISRQDDYRGSTALTLGNLGWCYYRLGDLDSAESYLIQAEALMARLGRWDDQQTALGNLGSVHFTLQDYKNALGYYQRALAIAEKFQFESSKALWLNNIAATYIEMGDMSTAEAYNRRALDLQSRLHDDVVTIWPMVNAAQIALNKADYASAMKISNDALKAAPSDPDVQWETHEGLAELYSRTGDPVHAQDEYRKAVGILDTSWSALLNNQSKLTFPSRLTRFYRRYVDFLMGQRRSQEALNFVESRRARLLAEKIGAQPASGSFQGLARRSDAVLLSYWLAPEQSYLWVTAPGGLHTFKLGPEAPIRDLVDRYSQTILASRDGASTGRELYDILIAPARELLPGGVRVVVVPDGCLHGLNFETLIAPSGRYWIEDATVEIAPSLRLLRQDRGSTGRNQSILLIGDPIRNDRALPELQFAGKEIADIASLYGDAVVKTREAARPEAYRAANPSGFAAIHFAAHAVPNRDSPLDSAVVLSPGKDSSKLYAREVQEIPLSAGLVTVSACQSAGARTYPGEGLVGFAWAFLSAGAHNVVASLWDVNDQSTALFMQALYTRVRRGVQPAAALREVKLEFLRSEGARRKPYYWAPFQLYVR